jgi:PKD repeat protein
MSQHRLAALPLLGLLLALPAAAATYYVRTDGGPPDRCDGRSDTAAPSSGTGLPCAWDHPFRALPPGDTTRIAPGDTVVIGPGSYQMGYGAPGADTCEQPGTWDCHMPPIPSGPSPSQPTRFVGSGWDSGCPSPPELWGTERADWILDLTGSRNVEVACLVVTDHSTCVEGHSGAIPCQRDTFPYGSWALVGLYAEDSSNVTLRDLDVHGLANTGVHAGRLTDWTVERVRIAGNGLAGWDGDIPGTDSNSGAMLFRHLTVEWNGCGETYPSGQPTGCWAQSAGGYGDGFGTGATSGSWVFEDSAFLHNTSDGLDLLYARSGSSITLRRVHAEGNAGDQIKTNGPVTIENTIAVSNCGSFEGQPFTLNVDACRAGGSALFLVLREGASAVVTNSTITGEGDILVTGECDSLYSSCNGQERVVLRNNIYIGNTEFLAPDDISALIYQETFPQGDQLWDVDYSVIRHVKDAACPGTHHTCGEAAAGLVNEGVDSFDAHLLASSPARDAGTPVGAPSVDFEGRPRDEHPDIGAYEYVSGGGGGGGESCTLGCSASAPPAGLVGAALAFSATATPSGCPAGSPTVSWSFGDGATASGTAVSHAYASAGTYAWSLTVTFAGASCSRSGSVTVTASPPAQPYSYTVPAVSHSPGVAGAVFRADVSIVNPGSAAASLTLTFVPAAGSPLVRDFTLPAHNTREFRDVLVSFFDFGEDDVQFGALQIGSNLPLVVSSRTYNLTLSGTFGGFLPAATASAALTTGVVGILPQLRKLSAFRTNVAVANLGAAPATVRVQLHGADGTAIGSPRLLTAPANGMVQDNDIFRKSGAGDQVLAYATVEVETEGARVFAFASLIDNTTNDPTLIPVVIPEE